MIRSLKRKLSLLFSAAVTLILAILLGCAFLFNQNQRHHQYELQLTQKMQALLQTLLQDGQLTDNQWAAREKEDLLILHLEDNGSVPLFCQRQLAAQAPVRQQLLDQLTSLVQQKTAVAHDPFSELSSSSDVYSFAQNGTRYYGMKSRVTGHRNCILTVLQAIPEYYVEQNRQILLYSLIFTGGAILLSVTGRLLIGRALRPIEENRLRQNRFIAAASHELRSPLAVVQTTAYALAGDPQQSSRFLKRIEDECSRMGLLISQMLTLACGDAGGWQVLMHEVPIDEILACVYERYEQAARREGRELTLTLPSEELPRLFCDDKAIVHILSILFDNAFSHTPPGSALALRCRIEKGTVCILIEDHGGGISDADKARVFERFYRSDQSRTDKRHFGLGLSIATELAAFQQASLTVCDTPGGGATFVLALPYKKDGHPSKKRLFSHSHSL